MAVVPRMVINNQKYHRHVRSCSSSGAGYEIRIDQQAGALGNFRTSGAAGPNLQWSFSLGQIVANLGGVPLAIVIPVPGATDLSSLYDCFQIEKVEVSVHSNQTTSNLDVYAAAAAGTGAYAVGLPMLGWAVDNDDSGATTLQELQQYSNYQLAQCGKPIHTSLVPLVATTLFSSPLSAYGRTQKQDVDCTYPNTPHYGLKMAIDDMWSPLTFTTTLLSFSFKIHYLMKSTR